MFPPVPRQLVIGIAATLLALLALTHGLARGAPAARPAAPPIQHGAGAAAANGNGEVLVDVAGEVQRPGVYHLPASARALDAIARAGGPTRRADLAAVNRAAPVVDGQQLVVPARARASAAAAPSAAVGGDAAAAGAPVAPVSLNSADAAALDALPGVGPVTAAHIVADRQAHGPFRSIDDLDRVPGIGPATIENLRTSLTL